MGQNLTPMEFYSACVEDFHGALLKKGYANRGLIFIPELLPLGSEAVLTYLQAQYFHTQSNGNANRYYYMICYFSFMTGIAYAEKWHSDYNELKESFADYIVKNGPADYALPLLEKELGVNGNDLPEEMLVPIFESWRKMLEPYWEEDDEDIRTYTFQAMMATYQAGVSTILEKYGY